MISGRIIVVRGKGDVQEDWGEHSFVALPSPADRIMVDRDGAENYATVLSVHHQPALVGSGATPTMEVVAKWTGAGKRMR